MESRNCYERCLTITVSKMRPAKEGQGAGLVLEWNQFSGRNPQFDYR